MYHNVVRGELSHGHSQHAQKMVNFGGSAARFSSYASRQTDRLTEIQTDILITISYIATGTKQLL